jgi:hypothetical protein
VTDVPEVLLLEVDQALGGTEELNTLSYGQLVQLESDQGFPSLDDEGLSRGYHSQAHMCNNSLGCHPEIINLDHRSTLCEDPSECQKGPWTSEQCRIIC